MARVIIPTCTIDVSTPTRPGASVKISPEDYPLVSRWKWNVCSKGYARRSVKRGVSWGKQPLHRLIANAQPGDVIDHRNGDTLDNRRENLRRADCARNMRNRKPNRERKFKGVFKNTKGSTFQAIIRKDGMNTYLGCSEPMPD